MQRQYQKPRVGVSACLLGDPVRFNGGHKRHAWLAEALAREVEFVPVCPEVEIGLGTPREPIDLVRVADGIRLFTMRTLVDLTDRMRRYAAARVDDLASLPLSGYVLKAESPSCGRDGVRIVGGDEAGRGVFADVLIARLPDLPVVEERELDDPAGRAVFVARVRAYHAKMRP
jgi:uncharacterized protein YbbK (DUF523 family)